MAGNTGPDIIDDGLIFYMDFSNKKFRGENNAPVKRLFKKGQSITPVNISSFGDDYLTLDGTDDYFDIELEGLSSNPTAFVSISAWIRWESFNSGMFLGFNGYDIWTSGNNLGFNTATGNVVGISSTQVNDLNLLGNWHHYVFVFSRSGLISRYCKLYINGESYELANHRGGDGNGTGFSNTLTLGSWNNRGYYGNVSYESISVYDREISQNEINKLFNLKHGKFNKPYLGYVPPPPPPPKPIETEFASAYEILQNNPEATSGYYYIKNPNINSGESFPIYADMETDGGGWTLIVRNIGYDGWNRDTALLRNSGSTSQDDNYSILQYADYLKRSDDNFEYMLEADNRNSNGGIWSVNTNYSFTSTTNTNTNITLTTKFGSWSYSNNGIEERMPYYSPNTSEGILTTSESNSSSWWGTIITSRSNWITAPWGSGVSSPFYIWYWVR